MPLWTLVTIAFGMSMDAFAVSVCKGLSMKKARLKHAAICGCWFGGFQAAMPLIGFYLASMFAAAIDRFSHWISFGLLLVVGANMIKEAMEEEDCECCEGGADLSFKTMLTMAVATSIDAMGAGITICNEGGNIFLAIALIGSITFAMSALGVKIGNRFGAKFEKRAEILGGAMLILMGVYFLVKGLLK